jgi:NADPH-dependent curcumin reductase CurA
MKNAIFATIAFAMICTAGAVAQYQDQDRHDQQATSHHVRKTTVRGYVRKDGDNYVVEDDRDKTRYRVQNTETVREHEGHHVQINARLHEDNRSLEVNKVKRLNDEEQRRDH